MEEAPENGKELSHSAHAYGMNDLTSLRPESSATVLQETHISQNTHIDFVNPWITDWV